MNAPTRVRTGIAAAIATASLIGVGTAPVDAATRRDVAGVWTATDHVDGSNLLLVITPRLRVLLFDDAATVCSLAPAVATGRGTLSGDVVEVGAFFVNCLNGDPDLTVAYSFTYDSATGTLTSPPDATGFDTYTRLF